jgi:hypothetical protein
VKAAQDIGPAVVPPTSFPLHDKLNESITMGSQTPTKHSCSVCRHISLDVHPIQLSVLTLEPWNRSLDSSMKITIAESVVIRMGYRLMQSDALYHISGQQANSLFVLER